MGNTPSNQSSHASNKAQSPSSSTASSYGSHPPYSSRAGPRRRESIQALSLAPGGPHLLALNPATAAPPSASLETAPAHQTPTTPRPNSRGRSQTVAATVASHLRAHDISFRDKAADDSKMGQHESKPRAHREITPPKATPPSPHTKPVDVPSLPKDESSHASRGEPSSVDPVVSPYDDYYSSPGLNRPPRLPLPIEEEVHTPGSPIISPADLRGTLEPVEADGMLQRRSSVLSSTTADEDELQDDYHHQEFGGRPAVPTILEWNDPGEKVYVTGTFAGNWDRKYRLHKNGPSPNKDALSALINVMPGTHHLKFLVDGDMKLSRHLPTAVDFTNILVNYLEVAPDDLPHQPARIAVPPKETEVTPVPTPVAELRAPPGIYPPQTLPPTPELQPEPAKEPEKPVPGPAPEAQPAATVSSSPKTYTQSIPRYLLDLDSLEESPRFERASMAASNLPTPPTLPMFLSKSILNGSTPMKDDSSVLILPNHTVLNHLATSSIKDNILATSATTRYKQKFLTTILYKPKNEDPEVVG